MKLSIGVGILGMAYGLCDANDCAALQQRRIANAMPTNPAAMQPSQTGALEAADNVFSVAESSAELGDKFKLSRGK